uniref:Uncharacterized protein n=1 Tax=Glossina pallidipes TaxID=7398 RepID=A0A1A9ZV01_GLOPL
MSTNFDKDLHDVLSRLLREYPVLWRPWAASTNGQYKELTRRLSSELNRAVTIRRVINTLAVVRKALVRLEGGSVRTPLTAYVWYAEELGYERAAKTMTKLIKREQRFQESVRLAAEGFLGFEEGVLVGNIPIIDDAISDVVDIICEGETETEFLDIDAPDNTKYR